MMDNFAPKKVFYDTAMNDTLYHSNDFDNISYKDLSNEMFNKLFDESIKPIAKTEVLENTKEYTKDEIETLLDGAIKFIISDDDDKDRTYTESELNIIKNCAINGIKPQSNEYYAKFPNLSPKSKFKSGDKVKIIKDYIMDIKRESVNFKGFECVVYSSLGLVSEMYNQNIVNCSYDVDINGFVVAGINESALELIEQPKKIEYRKDFMI